jgi:SAM-dependent methyltransferase
VVNLKLNSDLLIFIFNLLKEDERAKANYDRMSHNLFLERIRQNVGNDYFTQKRRILDLGCGKRFPHALMFALNGHDVIGVDMSYIISQPSLVGYFLSLKYNGFLDTVRYLQRDIMGKSMQYYQALLYPQNRVKHPAIKFVQDDASSLNGVENESIDIVVSKDLLEHVVNPQAVAKRINQILKQAGLCIHIIHLFPSISGGHNPEWSNFNKYQPWDHLRHEKFSLPGYLNKWRAIQYIDAFKQSFNFVTFEYYNFCKMDVNKALTDEIWCDIKDNHLDLERRELLSEKMLLIAKKS